MSTGTDRISKRDFIRKMAAVGGMQLAAAEDAYDAFLATVTSEVRAGHRVNLTGFGAFYRQRHVGHPVRFGGGRKPDYAVLKFSSTRSSNEFVGCSAYQGERVPGTRLHARD